MSKSYDIDHEAEHAKECFDEMLAALKLAAVDLFVGANSKGTYSAVLAAIKKAERCGR